MTPAARVQAAIEVLSEVLDGMPAEKALTNWARRSRFAGSKDRAAIRDHVFQALRCRRSYAALGGGMTGRGLMLGAMRQAGLPLDELFSGARFAPAALTPEESVGGVPEEHDLWDLPDWLIEEFERSLGDAALPTAQALRERAPVMVRVNVRKAGVEGVIAALKADGIEARQADIATTALTLHDGARKLAQSAVYQSGQVELQDGSSQAAMELVQVPAGSRVLDYCAGGGGKTLALAARHEAEWFAHDVHRDRMKDIPQRAERAGICVHLLQEENVAEMAPFDVVLCDVPCSGSGTWRRAPEAKWRLSQVGLQELRTTQQEILHQAASLVRSGGLLVYATCSVLTCENDDQIDVFRQNNPGWERLDQKSWPVSDRGDGFFAAVLRCKEGKNAQS